MGTITVYPEATDGHIAARGVGAFSAVHGASSGYVTNGSDTMTCMIDQRSDGTNSEIRRCFLGFDTRGIGAGNTVTAATLKITITVFNDGLSFDWISGAGAMCLVATTWDPTTGALNSSDFPKYGTTELANRVAMGATGQFTFTLNAAGRAYLNKTGATAFAIVSVHDLTNTAPAYDQVSYATFGAVEHATVGTRPILDVTYSAAATPAQISGSSSAAATGSLSLGTGGPVTVSPNASNATASASLSLGTRVSLGSLSSSATADGSLTLDTSIAVGVRAAPGWLGLFVTDTGGSPVPTISGGSTATATGSLSIVTPARALISGSSGALARGSLLLSTVGGGAAVVVSPTRHASAQFGSTYVRSDQFGATRSELVPQQPISSV